MTATFSAQGFIEIPDIFRETDAIKPGQSCDIQRIGKGEYQLRITSDEPKPKRRLVDVLLDCPSTGWMPEPDRSEMTSLQAPTLFEE